MHGFQADMTDEGLFESERELRGKHCRKLSRKTFGTVNSVAEAFALDYNEANTTWQTEYSHQYFVPPPFPKLISSAVVVKVHENKTEEIEDEDDDDDDEWIVIDQDDVPPLPVPIAGNVNVSELKTSKQNENMPAHHPVSSSSSSRHLAKHHVAPVSDQELALEDSFRRSRGFLARTPSTVPYNRYETEHQSAYSPKRLDKHHASSLYTNPSAIFNIVESDDTKHIAEAFTEGDFTTMNTVSVPERELFMALYTDVPPTVSEDKPSIISSHSNKSPSVSYTSSMLIAHVLDVASTIKPSTPPRSPPSTPPKKEQIFIQRVLSSAEERSPKSVSPPSSSNKHPSSALKLPTDWSFKPHINQLVRIGSSTNSSILSVEKTKRRLGGTAKTCYSAALQHKNPTNSNKLYKPVEKTKQRLGGTAKTCYSAALQHKSTNHALLEHAKKSISSMVRTIPTPADMKKKRTSGTAKTMAIAAQKHKLVKSLIPSTTSKLCIESSSLLPGSIAGNVSYGLCMTDIRNTLLSTVTSPGKTKLAVKREEFDFDGIVMNV